MLRWTFSDVGFIGLIQQWPKVKDELNLPILMVLIEKLFSKNYIGHKEWGVSWYLRGISLVHRNVKLDV